MILVAVLLLSGLALVAVEGVGYVRGRYNSAFWRLPLDEKLDHVADHGRDWWWVSIWSLVGLFSMTAGIFGFANLLADAGEPVLASVALGGYVVALMAWVLGLTVQTAGVSRAASQRVETGVTPAWIHPLWQGAYLAEGVWVIGTNLAYAVMGIAILGSGLVADWAGWVALVGGVATALVVVVVRDGFPQLGILIPAIIGVALLIEAI
ncbi:MAG: hypothetical protein PVF87_08805 [Acidimicrobiia bacterium]